MSRLLNKNNESVTVWVKMAASTERHQTKESALRVRSSMTLHSTTTALCAYVSVLIQGQAATEGDTVGWHCHHVQLKQTKTPFLKFINLVIGFWWARQSSFWTLCQCNLPSVKQYHYQFNSSSWLVADYIETTPKTNSTRWCAIFVIVLLNSHKSFCDI